jgi:NAD(P)-dependent dehydrogenase (short-subunit alcohol dehydrogenase family)
VCTSAAELRAPSFASGAVVVTGAASGIGRAAALDLAAYGRPLALWDIAEDALQEVADRCRDMGATVKTGTIDVGDREAVREALSAAARSLGGIGALVSCAGIALLDRAEAVDRAVFDRIFRVNLHGVVNLVEVGLPYLLEAGPGAAIAVVSSMDGINGNRYVASYTMSKHALNGFVRSAALSLGPRGVRVNAVCPGPVDTPMFGSGERNGPEEVARHHALLANLPLGYLCPPEQVATVLKFLISSDAAYVNGAMITLDGGAAIQ